MRPARAIICDGNARRHLIRRTCNICLVLANGFVALIPSRFNTSLKHYGSKKQREGTDILDVKRPSFSAMPIPINQLYSLTNILSLSMECASGRYVSHTSLRVMGFNMMPYL